jgi:hypothetical protein
VLIRKIRFFSRAICWIASTAEEPAPSTRILTPRSSIYSRASAPATFALF